jgi:proline iminopeptidase
MSTLYPDIDPFDSGFLQVSDLHTLYYEQSGNKQGRPVLFLHGGPGGASTPKSRRYFDPERYRIVAFDQRGAGQSTPSACLEENTTWDLVEDIERLRNHLGIEKWAIVFGGSWGSTLALAYAQTHADRVGGLVLRGIFLGLKEELQWFYQKGASFLFPDLWEAFIDPIPEEEHGDLISAYYHRLHHPDPLIAKAAAFAWAAWETGTISLLSADQPTQEPLLDNPEAVWAISQIENHYMYHGLFLDSDTHLLDKVNLIRHIPAHIVHGRYDIVCPLSGAYKLYKAWPEAQFHVVPGAGHSSSEPMIEAKLIEAVQNLYS